MKFLDELYKNDRMKQCDQEELSKKTGLGVSVIKNIESGRKKISPTHEQFSLICKVLNLDPYKYFTKNTRVITFLSNKGGSTKTSSASGLAFSLANSNGCKILLIDTDLQQNLTQNFCVIPNDDKNFYNAFVNSESIKKHIRPTAYDNIDIVTGHDKLAILDREITKIDYREYIMSDIIKEIKDSSEYDFIFIDCNPSLNAVNVSCLMATDGLIVPIVPSSFGKNGLDLIVDFYNVVQPRATNLSLLGVLVNRYDMRKKKPKEIIQTVKEKFGKASMVFDTMIPEDSNVDNSQGTFEPVGAAYPKSRASLAFNDLAEEVIKRAEKI